MKILSCFLFLWLGTTGYSRSQDLSGTWEGRVGGELLKLVIIKAGNTYVGYTYHEGSGYCKANFMGKFNERSRQVKGANPSFIDKTFGHALCTYDLKFTPRAAGRYLIGFAHVNEAVLQEFDMYGARGREIILKQAGANTDTTEYMAAWLEMNVNQTNKVVQNRKPDTLNTVSPLPISSPPDLNKKAFNDSLTAVKTRRTADTLRTIITAADSIVITIEDNEVVDGDTVTVFHNNEVLVSRLFVSAHPYRIVVLLKKEIPVHEFVLVANNLGSIPPNTALLTIEAGKERYQLKAASDLTKNAVILFKIRQ
ncbi:hypothetical protein A4D02_32040 [Niastella koreensis]|uniref:Uncharacterized protein n=2 Tax=Niastella koreensis TaxID=354356 RepID=G8TAQ3_NIAKG|nr:hypothetical protein [Niastella koreensis]AEV99233.1 hypothetical protein Niako_2900 [Niastella koreensis GR20-10]OQP46187.1 hypothetical protein A4D02_32040 [Niastella koreensis]